MTTLIQAQALTKHNRRHPILDHVSFEIARGQIVGLLGPNGAGKTTLLKALLGLTSCQGHLEVLGLQPREDRTELMERVCFIADVAILPKWLRVKQALDFIEQVHPRFNRGKALQFLERTQVPLTARVRHLSKGMVIQLHLALVMAIDVEILVLDEPTLGLDILFRKTFYRTLLNDYFTDQRTIIVATHQIEEIEGLLTQVMVLKQGHLVLNDSVENLQQRFVSVTVRTDRADAVRALHPQLEQEQLGAVKFLITAEQREAVAGIGTLSQPSLSEIYMATVSGEATCVLS